jgi:hypothetical protein
MLDVGCVQLVKVPGSSKGGVASAGRLFQQQHEWFTTTSMGAVHDWRTQAPVAGGGGRVVHQTIVNGTGPANAALHPCERMIAWRSRITKPKNLAPTTSAD